MKSHLSILALGLFILYSSTIKSQVIDSNVPEFNKRYLKNLSSLDENMFPFKNLINLKVDSLWSKFDSLPVVNGIPEFADMGARYYSNQTFNKNFNTYLIARAGDGDCISGMFLINCKKDSIILQKEIIHECGWETGGSQSSFIFLNDSTFNIFTYSRMNPFDSTGAILRNIYDCKSTTETFQIISNGGIILLHKTDKKWKENK